MRRNSLHLQNLSRRFRQSRRTLSIALMGPAALLSTMGCGPTNKTGIVTDLTPTAVTITTSTILLNSGNTLTLTGTIKPGAAPGYVAFFDGSTSIGVVQLSSGTATLTLSNLSTGTHTLSVGYGGSSAYYASLSGTLAVTVM